GYWMHARQNLQLEPGVTLILPPDSDGNIRASQVGNLSFSFFCVDPMRLMGVMTLAEQGFFRRAGAKEEFVARILPPHHAVAVKLRELFADRKRGGSLLRLQLLQKFIEAFGNELNYEQVESEVGGADAKQRLSEFLRTTQTSELINFSF